MGRQQNGSMAEGKPLAVFKKRRGRVVRVVPKLVMKSTRGADGLYSCLGLSAGATRKAIQAAYEKECQEVKLRRKNAKSCQGRTGATLRQRRIDEAFQILSCPEQRAAYDEEHNFIKPGSTARGRLRRAGQSKEEQQIEQAVNTASKRLKAAGANGVDHETSRLRSVGRKLAKKRKPTAANKHFGSSHFIEVLVRSRTERRRKKSRGKFVAVKGSKILV
jgi:DnaJ-class molecular chaperone